MLPAEDIVQMAKDAERYRWMRAHQGRAIDTISQLHMAEDFDSLVDAAMGNWREPGMKEQE
jgi:hypothetical protein